MKRIVILFTVISLLISCYKNKQEETILLENFSIPTEMNPKWSSLFTNKYTIIPLETRDDCLVGQIDKIKKFNGHYYISSSGGQSILHFNEQGKFISSLNKLGQGPEEYHRIEDFDVYEVNGQTEVWISDNKNLKIYDPIDFSFKYKIPYSFIIHKFRRLENSHILLVTGQNENILTLTDQNGNIISKYLENKIPFIMFRPIQFVKYNSEYLFQLGISNAYVALNTQTEIFSRGVFSKETSFISDKKIIDLFNDYGTDFIMEANKESYINNVLFLNNICWIQTCYLGENYLTKIQNNKIISTKFYYGDILSTITVGDSDDSILLYINAEQIDECDKSIIDKYKETINPNIEDNPYILEFYYD